jgi:hypothetical protein
MHAVWWDALPLPVKSYAVLSDIDYWRMMTSPITTAAHDDIIAA